MVCVCGGVGVYKINPLMPVISNVRQTKSVIKNTFKQHLLKSKYLRDINGLLSTLLWDFSHDKRKKMKLCF